MFCYFLTEPGPLFPPVTSLSFILDTHDSDLIDSYCDTKRGLGLQSQKLACSNVFSCLYWVSNFLIIVRINKNAVSELQYNPSSQKVYSASPSSLMQPPSLLPHPWCSVAAGETLPIWHDWGVVNLFPWLRELEELMDFSQLQCSCASARKVKNVFSQGKICAQTRNRQTTLFVQNVTPAFQHWVLTVSASDFLLQRSFFQWSAFLVLLRRGFI